VRLALERLDVLLLAEVVTVTEIDVARAAERGETETEPADRQARPPEDVDAKLRRTKSIATGTPCSSKRSRSWFSTQ
jgi:hypothetical protein